MSQSARITSIDALQTAATALLRFRSECADALDELELATRRVQGWIRHDRKDYWARELRRCEDAVTQARAELRKARTMHRDADSLREPVCIDEERALRRAERRQEAAQQQVDSVRRWTRTVEHAIDEYQRRRVQFTLWLDGDLGKAVAALNRMSEALETYTSLEPPKQQTSDAKGDCPNCRVSENGTVPFGAARNETGPAKGAGE